jgi:hypothetical protein
MVALYLEPADMVKMSKYCVARRRLPNPDYAERRLSGRWRAMARQFKRGDLNE